MKVTRDTPEQLILAETPWLLGVTLVLFILFFVGAGLLVVADGELLGLLFAGMGGGLGFGAFAVFVVRVQVIFDRVEGVVVMRSRSVFGYTEVRHDLADLDGAVLEETTGSKGGPLYRPTLVFARGMSAGRHPVVTAYTNGRGPGRAVEAINRWLAAGERQDTPARLDSAPHKA